MRIRKTWMRCCLCVNCLCTCPQPANSNYSSLPMLLNCPPLNLIFQPWCQPRAPRLLLPAFSFALWSNLVSTYPQSLRFDNYKVKAHILTALHARTQHVNTFVGSVSRVMCVSLDGLIVRCEIAYALCATRYVTSLHAKHILIHPSILWLRNRV